MITHRIYGVREAVIALAVLAALAFLGIGTAFAQTTSSFTPPAGYDTQIGNTGIYYNSAAGLYYNPMTGQYSNLPPLGPATMNTGGSYVVPTGYSVFNSGPYYYNSAAGFYYDPATGFYSTTAPVSTGVSLTQAQSHLTTNGSNTSNSGGATVMPNTQIPVTTVSGVITPGVPNTGAGGDTTGTLALLAVLAVVAAGGAIALSRRLV